MRMEKQKRKVKVYGLDSTASVRARLIEILMERVRYHKDKFVSPIIHEEMKSMQVKKNGKVEHSDKTHDDQVFSYLMALYVWYDGKNLAENFRIRKTSIKTDSDEIIEELEIEDALEKKEKVDFNSSVFEANPDIAEDLEWVEADAIGFKTSTSLKEDEYAQMLALRNNILSTHPDLLQAAEHEFGVSTIQPAATSTGFTTLSPTIFMMGEDDDEMFTDEQGNPRNISNKRPLAGNLSHMYDYL